MDGHDSIALDQQRLAEIARLATRGEAVAAEMQLLDWCRDEGCPATTRVMLASMLARRGDWHGARNAVGEVWLADIDRYDPRLVQMLVGLLLAQGLDDAAGRLAVGLRRMAGDEAIAEWADLLRLAETHEEDRVDPLESDAATLAVQLRAQPTLIPTLAYAQKLEPRAERIALLRAALLAVEPELCFGEHHSAISLALAELAELAEDHADARRWAERGLMIDPYNAALALVLDRCSGDPAAAAQAGEVLARVTERLPYPDLRAALIRREFATGQRESARDRLRLWLERDPACPMAQRTQRELAA